MSKIVFKSQKTVNPMVTKIILILLLMLLFTFIISELQRKKTKCKRGIFKAHVLYAEMICAVWH